MPRWDFDCETCQRTFELVFRRLDDANDVPCPKCGNTLTRKPASGSFTITGFNARNGYAKLQG
jgi:putative FmdB family regulatory protein